MRCPVVHEWSVMLTDWLLAAVCLWLGCRLLKFPHASQRLVGGAFATAAVSALVGGLRHGMGPWFPEGVYAVLWFFSYALIPPAWSLLLWGVIRARARGGRWLVAGTAVSSIAGIVQLGWPLGAHGTLHNDAFHLLMIPAIYLYYRAALLFREPPNAPSLH